MRVWRTCWASWHSWLKRVWLSLSSFWTSKRSQSLSVVQKEFLSGLGEFDFEKFQSSSLDFLCIDCDVGPDLHDEFAKSPKSATRPNKSRWSRQSRSSRYIFSSLEISTSASFQHQAHIAMVALFSEEQESCESRMRSIYDKIQKVYWYVDCFK